MDAVPLVRIGAFLPFVGFLDRHGMPAEERLREFLIPRQPMLDVEGLVPLNQALRLIEDCARASGLTDLGLRVGRDTHVADLGVFGRFILRAATLREAIRRICQVSAYFNPGHAIWLEPWEDRVRLCQRLAPDLCEGRKHGEQFTLMLLLEAVRAYAGPGWRPDAIQFDGSLWKLPPHAMESVDAPVRPNGTTAIVLDPALLDLPPVALLADGVNGEEDERQRLEDTAPARDFVGSMEQIVQLYLTDEHFGIKGLAAVVGVSPRTLQRRLAEHGEEFSDLVDRVRYTTALGLMKRGMKFIDVAYELGYSDPAGFTRAFRRWSGRSPSEYLHRSGNARVD